MSPRYEKGRDGSQDMIVTDEAVGHGLGAVLTVEQVAARQECHVRSFTHAQPAQLVHLFHQRATVPKPLS